MRHPKWLDDAKAGIVLPDTESTEPKVLLFDIETAPIGAYVWGHWKQNTLRTIRPWYILSVAYTWLGSGEYHFIGINEDPSFTPDTGANKLRPNVDRWVVSRMWHLFDQADVVVAHNGDKFDIKKTNARFMNYHLTPPSPYAKLDTLKEVKRYSDHGSHRLNDLAQSLTGTGKAANMGITTWIGCMAGDPEQWRIMHEYNLVDVRKLEDLYRELIPWIGSPGHQNAGGNARAYSHGITCTRAGCGGTRLQARGKRVTSTGLRYQTYQCQKCGGWMQARYAEREHIPSDERVK